MAIDGGSVFALQACGSILRSGFSGEAAIETPDRSKPYAYIASVCDKLLFLVALNPKAYPAVVAINPLGQEQLRPS